MPKGVKPSFELAMPDKFVEQCKNSDVIYFHGGETNLIISLIRNFDLPTVFNSKVIATNSASSDMLSRHYWSCDKRVCANGLGIFKIKFIPHYNSNYGSDDPRGPIDWSQAKKDLEQYGDKKLPIYALEEGEYIIFEE